MDPSTAFPPTPTRETGTGDFDRFESGWSSWGVHPVRIEPGSHVVFDLYGVQGLSAAQRTVSIPAGTYRVTVAYRPLYELCWPAGPSLAVEVGGVRVIDFATESRLPGFAERSGTVTVPGGSTVVRIRLFSGSGDDLCQGALWVSGIRIEAV